MSSIYRKGRDGYFYYQTYVRNKNSGKMDKRIYHSLGTKNEDEAKNLKIYYDKLYIEKKKIKKKLPSILYFNTKAVLILSLVLVFFFFFTLISNKKELPLELPQNTSYALDKKNNSELFSSVPFKEDLIINTSDKISTDLDSAKSDTQKPALNIDSKNFVVQREESVFGEYEQGNIFITTKYKKPDELKYLCKMIKKQFNQYKSIIISVYSDNYEGVAIARGIASSTDNDYNNTTWLAMYTFHPLEGEFFDSKPYIYHQKY